jgi:hypothetical protein
VAADSDAFLQLSDAELAALGRLGVRRAVAAGEYLYRQGVSSYDFYVVLAGAVEIVVEFEGKEWVIARSAPDRPSASRPRSAKARPPSARSTPIWPSTVTPDRDARAPRAAKVSLRKRGGRIAGAAKIADRPTEPAEAGATSVSSGRALPRREPG